MHESDYDPNLLALFEEQHCEIRRLFDELQRAAHDGNRALLKERFAEFSSLLQGHMIEENLRLYTYLSKAYKDRPQESELIDELRSEMGSIGNTLIQFMATYAKVEWTDNELQAFIEELGEINSMLLERVGREEEKLYPLYRNTPQS